MLVSTRVNKSVKNIHMSFWLSAVTILVGLIAQSIFISTLGIEYLGINGLFTNIVSMLGLVELGLGAAVYYYLYKALATNDTERIKSLVGFFKKSYRVIALSVFVLGICVIPFLSLIVGDINISVNISFIYLLFLVDIVASYLLIYKRSVLYADQNNYILSIVHIGYILLVNGLQIAILLTTRNYYMYLAIKIIMRLAENVLLTIISNKKYPFLKDKSVEPIDDLTKKDLFKKIKGLSFHKIGSYLVLGTDSIIISIFFGITTVGLYSNYFLVIGAINLILYQAMQAITASVGNLLYNNSSKISFEVYKKLRFANFWVSCLAFSGFLVVMNSFITVWIGHQYLLSISVLFALSINLYLTLIRGPVNSFKEAAGIFYEDRYVPIVESVVNIVLGLILLHIFGLAGVFIATICSTLILHLYSYPKFVYIKIFKENYGAYYKELAKFFALALIIAFLTFVLSRLVTFNSNFTQFIFTLVLSLIVPNLILLILFRNNEEFKFYRMLAINTIISFKRNK
jgi:O-antigen/teichoic acid export membrane protein